MAASRLLRAVAAFVILLSFAAGSRKSSWSEWLHESCEMDLLADFLHFGTKCFFVARRFRAVWSVGRKGREECSVKCELWRKQWEVRSVKCGVWSVKCGVWSLSLECEERSVKCEVWSVKEAVRSEKCEVWTVKCEVWSVKCGVWSLKFGVRRVQCEVWSVKTLLRLSLKKKPLVEGLSSNYRSFIFGKLPPPACPGTSIPLYIYIFVCVFVFFPLN